MRKLTINDDRQTDGRTDGETERPLAIARRRAIKTGAPQSRLGSKVDAILTSCNISGRMREMSVSVLIKQFSLRPNRVGSIYIADIYIIDIYRIYIRYFRSKISYIFDIFENITIFSNPTTKPLIYFWRDAVRPAVCEPGRHSHCLRVKRHHSNICIKVFLLAV